jgi:hypothetical protein
MLTCESYSFLSCITFPSLPTCTTSVRSQCILGPRVVTKFQLMCLKAKSHFVQTHETAVIPTVYTEFVNQLYDDFSWNILVALLNKQRRILGSVRVAYCYTNVWLILNKFKQYSQRINTKLLHCIVYVLVSSVAMFRLVL